LDATYTLVLSDGNSITHERRFVLLKDRELWLIRDRVIGKGAHTIETRFHFAEGVDVAPLVGQGYRTLCNSGPNLVLIAPGSQPPAAFMERGWVSQTYAVKREIRVLRFVANGQLPFEQWYILVPSRGDASQRDVPMVDWEALLRSENESSTNFRSVPIRD
jgi:hypothetical protein